MIKSEHNGAKNGGGYWGTRAEAKALSRTARRQQPPSDKPTPRITHRARKQYKLSLTYISIWGTEKYWTYSNKYAKRKSALAALSSLCKNHHKRPHSATLSKGREVLHEWSSEDLNELGA